MRGFTILADFDESLHPRDDHGRFGEGSAGTSDARLTGGQTRTNLLGPESEPLKKTEAGDYYEVMLAAHGDQLAQALGADKTQQLTIDRRQNPLDFRAGDHGLELKTMANIPGAKTGIRADDRLAKEAQAAQLGLKPGLVVQVVSQNPDGSGKIGVYYKDGFRSNTVVSAAGKVITEGPNAWSHLFDYSYSHSEYAKVASQAKALRASVDRDVPDGLNQPGDLVIEIKPDGTPTDYEIEGKPMSTITPELLAKVKNPLGVLWGYPPIAKDEPTVDPHAGDPLHDPAARIRRRGGNDGTPRGHRHK